MVNIEMKEIDNKANSSTLTDIPTDDDNQGLLNNNVTI